MRTGDRRAYPRFVRSNRRSQGALLAVAVLSFAALVTSLVNARSSVHAAPGRPCARPDLVLAVPAAYTFASIGDFGDFPTTGRVAATIAGWNPEFIVTVGDNGYNPDATSNGAGGFVWAGSLIDRSIGQWFSPYIGNYQGTYAGGPAPGRPSRFFPALGNHDWDGAPGGGVWANLPYRSYFSLPGNERYYTVRAGSVQFFVIDSDPRSPGNGSQYETDGVSATSTQASWLRDHLADSDARFKIVLFHHPPYTSAPRGSITVLRWPFAEWGASLVLAGHEHMYERLDGPGGIPFVVAGHGGNTLTNSFPNSPSPAVSQVRVGDRIGALRLDVTPTQLTLTAVGQPVSNAAAPFATIDQISVPAAPVLTPNPDCATPPGTTLPPSRRLVATATAGADRLGSRP